MQVEIKKMSNKAVIPYYATSDSAGMDMTSARCEFDPKTQCYIYHTDIAIEIPKGYVELLFPRSSNRKTNVYLTNSVSIIDSDYKTRDEESVGTNFPYNNSDRIG